MRMEGGGGGLLGVNLQGPIPLEILSGGWMEGRMHGWVWWWWGGGASGGDGWWESDVCTPLHIAQVGSNL